MTDSHTPLRIMTFNLRYGSADDGDDAWPTRGTSAIAAIDTLAPDLLGTQEGLPFQLEEIDAALPDFGRVGLGRYHGVAVDRPHEAFSGEHCALYYRRPRLRVVATDTRWLSETPDEPGSHGWGAHLARVVTRAVLADESTGRRITMLNTHFHWGAEITAGSARLLAALLRDVPDDAIAILTGDFNLPPGSPEHADLLAVELAGGRRLVDAWDVACSNGSARVRRGEAGLADTAAAGSDAARRGEGAPVGGAVLQGERTEIGGDDATADAGTSHGFSGVPQRRIDWILVSSDVEVVAAAIDRRTWGGRYPSDHFPVVVDLRLPK